MKKPFISIVIPTWRESDILTRCLTSLLSQNYPRNRFEIILVSRKKIKPFFKRVKTIQIKNQNHAEARNIGVRKSKGEIIAFCDDDCLLPKNWLKAAASYFKKTHADLIGGPALPPKNAPFSFRLAGYLSGTAFSAGFGNSRWRLIYPNQEANEFNLILANTFIKKAAFEQFGGFDKDQVPCEENFLYAKLKNNGYKLFYCPQVACLHPAKPIFFPWAKKIYFYATGRGLLISRAPETFHPQYLIPSLFLLSLFILGFLSPFSLLAFSYFLAIILVYTGLTLANAFYIFLKFERNPAILVIAPIETLIVHLSYGLGFLNGLIRYFIGRREAVKMLIRD